MHIVIEKSREGGWCVALRDFLDLGEEIPLFEGGPYEEENLKGFPEFLASLEERGPALRRYLAAQDTILVYVEKVVGQPGGGVAAAVQVLDTPFVLEGHLLDRRQEALIPCENSPGCEIALCACGARVHSHAM